MTSFIASMLRLRRGMYSGHDWSPCARAAEAAIPASSCTRHSRLFSHRCSKCGAFPSAATPEWKIALSKHRRVHPSLHFLLSGLISHPRCCLVLLISASSAFVYFSLFSSLHTHVRTVVRRPDRYAPTLYPILSKHEEAIEASFIPGNSLQP